MHSMGSIYAVVLVAVLMSRETHGALSETLENLLGHAQLQAIVQSQPGV